MIIELNPMKWFAPKTPAVPASPDAAQKAATPAAAVVQESVAAKAEESVMANKFIGFLEAIGKDFIKGLGYAVKFAVPIEKLVALLFPPAAAAAVQVGTAAELIRNAVVSVEQKYAAAGVQAGTGAQKSAEVLLLTEAAVTSLLSQAGIAADTGYVQRLVDAVVAILNVQSPPTVAAPAA